MPDLATIGALGGLIIPVYAALYQIGRTLGRVEASTEHNEQAVEDINGKVDRLEAVVCYENAEPEDLVEA